MTKNNIYLVVSWGLVIIWMLIIFAFSAVNGEDSTSSSINMISKTVEITSNVLYKVRIIKKPLSRERINEIADALNKPVRKTMHMGEYFILTILLCNALFISKVKRINILGFLIALLYSITDEFHQLFTMRTGSIIDVLIDSIGIVLALGFIYIFKKSHVKVKVF